MILFLVLLVYFLELRDGIREHGYSVGYDARISEVDLGNEQTVKGRFCSTARQKVDILLDIIGAFRLNTFHYSGCGANTGSVLIDVEIIIEVGYSHPLARDLLVAYYVIAKITTDDIIVFRAKKVCRERFPLL